MTNQQLLDNLNAAKMLTLKIGKSEAWKRSQLKSLNETIANTKTAMLESVWCANCEDGYKMDGSNFCAGCGH